MHLRRRWRHARAYAIAHRNKRVRVGLPTSDAVTAATTTQASIPQPLLRQSQVLGFGPTDSMKGCSGRRLYARIPECSLGPYIAPSEREAVSPRILSATVTESCGASAKQFPRARLIGGDDRKSSPQGRAFVEAPADGLNLPLDKHRLPARCGTRPPHSNVSTAASGDRREDRCAERCAVARACATNRIAVAIPAIAWCADGGLSGYREVKRSARCSPRRPTADQHGVSG
jgi:AraC family transcriptional regulator of adaptative response/methylated-DNA-[protein]-cysteine methyltransferase